MNSLYLIAALAVISPSAFAGTCDECMTTFKAIGTPTCEHVKTALQCLLDATGTTCASGANAPSTQVVTGTDTLFAKGTALDPTCPPSAVCIAQANYASTVAARTTASTLDAKCKEAVTYASAVGAVTDASTKACDGTATQPAILTKAITAATTDCHSYAAGLKSSVLILAMALFVSYLKL